MSATSTDVSTQDVVERALQLSRTQGCIVIAQESSEANLRWAANTLTTNGVMRSRSVTVIATAPAGEGIATGVVSRSNVALDEVEALVREAEQRAEHGRPADDAHPLIGGSDVPESGHGWDDPPAETSIGVFTDLAATLGSVFGDARSSGRELFGFAEHQVFTTYLGMSTGVRVRHVQPTGRIEVTGKTADWSRSSWIGHSTRDFSDIDMTAVDADLARRLGWAGRRVDLDAGRFETLLPPSAVADLLAYLYWTAIARDADDGRTVFSRQGGGTRVGERLAEKPLRIWSDPAAPGLECDPVLMATSSGSSQSVFDNGTPLRETDWIRDGELQALIQTRHSAEITGLPYTPGVDNLLMSSADSTRGLDDMIAATDRGLLLTCLWYIREVDPQTLLLTGLTRDGVYLVEGGEVVAEVNNFRFNESPVDLLGRLSEVGLTERTLAREFGDYFTRTAMPTWRVPDFNMSSVSKAS
ncbi:MAG TPA: metallopeptidase TldD-related protein [Actinomycetes bacterium]|jgi:predicted Zn-dependent protease|nr:metallopeptidase TldD-related protein [Actinomycetes bacterium]